LLRTRNLLIALGLAATALSAAPAASAQTEPGTFATARRGPLIVSSSALVSARNVEMMGGWNNDTLPCDVFRRLDVRILIDRVRVGTTNRVRRLRSSPVRNCAEGGPNFGFSIRASNVGLACADGTWRPGIYTFVTNTLHRASNLRAIATLFFEVRNPC
jgi:hypothetical protein